MARKKPRKKNRLRTLALFVLVPFAVWLMAFLIWFYWYDLRRFFAKDSPPGVRPAPAGQSEGDQRNERLPAKPPQEKIFEEDRKNLEDILKRRN